mmetsp:Transcript_91222/g.158156  ORF Transcript_91222/g.158156 Transcript_91222/m.158156 type:complete len:334 (-) Transcript_91222:54-1055(-)
MRLLELLELVLQHQQPGTCVLEGHFVLLVVGQLVPQRLDFLVRLLQGLIQTFVLLRNFKHELLVVLLVPLHVGHLLLEGLDQVQVFAGDVVVVLFDLREGRLMLGHQLLNVLVLAFLNVVDLRPAPQLQLVAQDADLPLVLFGDLPRGLLRLDLPDAQQALMGLALSGDLFLMLGGEVPQVLVQAPLGLLHVPNLLLVLVGRLGQRLLPRLLQLLHLHLVLVQQVPHLLLVYLHLHLVALLSVLDLPILDPELVLGRLELPLGDGPELVDLVPLQLEVVAQLLGLGQGLRDLQELLHVYRLCLGGGDSPPCPPRRWCFGWHVGATVWVRLGRE